MLYLEIIISLSLFFLPDDMPPPTTTTPTLYFAFGSNLHLAQMSLRCPSSKYISPARLRNYRFQINERGYANVVPSAGDHVEGLVYELSGDDERRLDVNEGVPWAYEKWWLGML